MWCHAGWMECRLYDSRVERKKVTSSSLEGRPLKEEETAKMKTVGPSIKWIFRVLLKQQTKQTIGRWTPATCDGLVMDLFSFIFRRFES